ncbi:class I SAM-dependent methyltransferase [Aurantiacibacter sp. MUD61]|uniref:class I SAM-dependent methyltransferase n=1 Tax=Aurantiacibacter sp. MUD61 TaxID=3009083 RepID=UPI0022F1343E|nr:methyltransferase domain-containing protein [Aurantiacibacter sp. MUD61]
MKSNDLARQGKTSIRTRVKRALGPAGVFFKGFLEEPRMVGSVIPSSKVTIDAMLDPLDWDNCQLFVEYGPGVGTFCPHILDRLPRGGELLVIDTNPLFIDYLRKTFGDSRFHAVLGSAEDVEAIVKSLGHESADYVLSGLPFSTLPDGVGENIAAATYRVLREGGAFLTYQFKGVARDLTARHFPRVETGFVWRNIPPCILAWGYKDTSAKAADAPAE